MIRLVLVDDHPVIRQGLATVLEAEGDLQVVGQAGSVSELLALLPHCSADVMVADLEMPGPDIQQHFSALPTVVFTAHEERHIVAQALRHGARGYVLKGAPIDELITAIRWAQRGETYLQARVAAHWAETLRAPTPALTTRQQQILELVAGGHSNKEIGARLGLTERTAKFHVTSILNKLGAENRAQAVAIAAHTGLL